MTVNGLEAVVRATRQAFGNIDILVNNAGGSSSASAAGWFETPMDEWAESYRQNALPAVQLAQAFVPAIAVAVCFIASPLSDFMTGTTIRIDGGATPTG